VLKPKQPAWWAKALPVVAEEVVVAAEVAAAARKQWVAAAMCWC
jgi:hypothetical protein